MPRIRCSYFNCLYLDDDICTASAVEIDPDLGCATYAQSEEDVQKEGEDYEDRDTEDLDVDMDDNEEGEGWD